MNSNEQYKLQSNTAVSEPKWNILSCLQQSIPPMSLRAPNTPLAHSRITFYYYLSVISILKSYKNVFNSVAFIIQASYEISTYWLK